MGNLSHGLSPGPPGKPYMDPRPPGALGARVLQINVLNRRLTASGHAALRIHRTDGSPTLPTPTREVQILTCQVHEKARRSRLAQQQQQCRPQSPSIVVRTPTTPAGDGKLHTAFRLPAGPSRASGGPYFHPRSRPPRGFVAALLPWAQLGLAPIAGASTAVLSWTSRPVVAGASVPAKNRMHQDTRG